MLSVANVLEYLGLKLEIGGRSRKVHFKFILIICTKSQQKLVVATEQELLYKIKSKISLEFSFICYSFVFSFVSKSEFKVLPPFSDGHERRGQCQAVLRQRSSPAHKSAEQIFRHHARGYLRDQD